MKFIYKIFFAIAVLVLSAVSLLAHERDEISASWESEASGKLFGDFVVKNFSAKGNHFKLNSLCSLESFHKIKNIRNELFQFIKNQSSSEQGNLSLEKTILEKIISSDISPVKYNEKILIEKTDSFCFDLSTVLSDVFSSSELPEEIRIFLTITSFNSISSNINFIKKKNGETYYSEFQSNLNISNSSLDCSKVNYFKLFLYLWENNPEDNSYKYNFFILLDKLSTSPCISVIPFQNNFHSTLKHHTESESRLLRYTHV